MDKFICHICSKCLNNNSNLLRHKRAVHNVEPDGINPAPRFSCNLCNYSTSRSDSLKSHKARHHKNNDENENRSVSCAMCEWQCGRKGAMLEHYKSNHGISITEDNLEFDSLDEFNSWKRRVEIEDQNQYIQVRGVRRTADDCKKITYACFRDGKSKSHATKRLGKKLGSNKIGAYCPARMEVTTKLHKVIVSFFSTHVGHTKKIARFRLTPTERAEIARKLSEKIPVDDILDYLRDNIACIIKEQSVPVLIACKDLHSIARDYHTKAEVMRHSNNSTSVHSWVLEMQEYGDIVRYFKPQGVSDPTFGLAEDDFVLIIMNELQVEMLSKFGNKVVCMDGTHDLSAHGFDLITLLVLDNLNEGFPVAFMFTNITSTTVLEIFLTHIRETINSAVATNVFMSDMAEKFSNAWNSIMGNPTSRLFCTWHVDRAWRKNLLKVKGRNNQMEIYKTCRILMQETDKKTFESMLGQFFELYDSNPSTAEFVKYFKDEYVHNCKCWAYCYRQRVTINTNMALERMHCLLKYIYLNDNKPKRLDITLHAIMRLLRDRCFERLITLNREKLPAKVSAIRDRHKTALDLRLNSVTFKEPGCWTVLSSRSGDTYEIKEVLSSCNCNLCCADCEICIHSFICSCIDSAIKFNMCKHIHLVRRAHQRSLVTTEPFQDSDREDEIVIDNQDDSNESYQNLIFRQLTKSVSTPSKKTLDELREEAIQKFTNIINKKVSCEKDLEVVNNMLNTLEMNMEV